jgi:hypothetical protein
MAVERLYEFCITTQKKGEDKVEVTDFYKTFSTSEHEARRKLIRRMLRQDLWVKMMVEVEDCT